MKLLLIISTFILVLSNVHANDSYKLQVNIGSHHFSESSEYGFDKPWNETNIGLGLVYQYNDNHSVAVGYYDNSINYTSIYASYKYSVRLSDSITTGLEFNLVTGYNKSVLPIITPQISFEIIEDVELNFNIIPKVKELTPMVIGFSLSIGF